MAPAMLGQRNGKRDRKAGTIRILKQAKQKVQQRRSDTDTHDKLLSVKVP